MSYCNETTGNVKATSQSCVAKNAVPENFIVEAVTVSVGCGDFLAHTLPLNMHHFDRIVVVTEPQDKDTINVCDHYGVKYVATNKFQPGVHTFCKGLGINEGLKILDRKAWMVHLDSDIILPPHFRRTLARMDLDTSYIFGMDRFEFKSYDEWQRFHGKPVPQVGGNGMMVDMQHTGRPLGTRVMFDFAGGYAPIGYFQMWHADSGVFKYQEGHTDAGREDSHFAIQWPRMKRMLLPEFIACHLESENAPMSVNWKGRETKPFGIGN